MKDTTSLLRLQDLSQYNLAVCADGSPASYYAEQREVSIVICTYLIDEFIIRGNGF